MNQENAKNGAIEKWNEFYKMKDEMTKMKRKLNEEKAAEKLKMKEEMATKKRKMMDEIVKEMDETNEENAKLKRENRALKMKIEKMESDLKSQNLSIRRIMPTELLNELFGSLPLENAFGLLAKMPYGLLARNVQKMIKSIKEAMKENKLNEEDCGSNLTITEGGLVAKHSGPTGLNSDRAILPIPTFSLNAINKPTILFYFEMEILAKSNCNVIGFCGQQFPLQVKWLGGKNTNSIGIWRKNEMWIDGSIIKFGNDCGEFKKGDFVGLGIIHRKNSKMECFAIWNGKLLGKAELPSKFNIMQLFPTVDLYCVGDSIRANFMKESWKFKEFGRVLE